MKIIESGSLAPQAIMDKDAFLLRQLSNESDPILHLYEWDASCLTYGYFTNPANYLDLQALNEKGLQKARRPTGGGIIFHLSDLAFSILVPSNHSQISLNTLENYAFINEKVAEVVARITIQPHLLKSDTQCFNTNCHAFCMAKPTQYDLIIEGKKVGGAAQRRTKQGLLHQASLSLLFPPVDLLARVLTNPEVVLEAMQKNSYCLLPLQANAQDLQEMRNELKKLLKEMQF